MDRTIKTLKKMTFKHYWICDACAKERGGESFKSCVTVALIKCGYCKGKNHKETDYTTPYRDLRWPKNE